jgi:hypothetical protein
MRGLYRFCGMSGYVYSSGIRDFKRNIGREAGFFSIAGSGIDTNTMAICIRESNPRLAGKSTMLIVCSKFTVFEDGIDFHA